MTKTTFTTCSTNCEHGLQSTPPTLLARLRRLAENREPSRAVMDGDDGDGGDDGDDGDGGVDVGDVVPAVQ